MTNHFHLVVETPNANLVAGMKWFLGTYTARFNRRHRYFGHLFSGRYKSLIVDGSGSEYLRTVCRYVHLNPSRAGLVGREERLKTIDGVVLESFSRVRDDERVGCGWIVYLAILGYESTAQQAEGSSSG